MLQRKEVQRIERIHQIRAIPIKEKKDDGGGFLTIISFFILMYFAFVVAGLYS